MKLDRSITNPRRGKYALIKLRDVELKFSEKESGEELVSVPASAVDFGDTADSDFFVIRLKDKYAAKALKAYAEEAAADDTEYANEVYALALKASEHPNRKIPD